ncbi:MAG TPA: maleylpyruvate isomerase family mycothiol-dependent enzyme [Mycobacteriales bacterium]|nr:maleylpyruvate isomerase family mycothiol-dependent enzyme [Mycobacteriales bacterium]
MNATTRGQVQAELDELIGVLREIPDVDWDKPSACDGFRVRDVAAHLSLVAVPLNGRILNGFAGSFSRFMRLAGEYSREVADESTPAELIEKLEQRRAAPTKGFIGKIEPPQNMLTDHATHLQDVRVGLDRRAEPDKDRARVVLEAAVKLWRPITWGTKQRAKGLRLTATDIGWSHGDGPEVSGPYDAMLLALGGRSAGLASLTGDGLATLTSRMPTSA